MPSPPAPFLSAAVSIAESGGLRFGIFPINDLIASPPGSRNPANIALSAAQYLLGKERMTRRSIARLDIEALFRDATRKKVRLSVSAPWKRDGHWLAEPKISGLGESLIPMAGVDSMQALTLALKCIVVRLESLEKKMRFRLVWPGTKKKFELREFLIDPGVRHASKNA